MKFGGPGAECHVSPQNPCWSPNPQCDSVLRQGLWEIISLGKVMPMMGLVFLEEEKRLEFILFSSWGQLWQLSPSQERSSHQEQSLPAPWSWICQELSGRQECLNVCGTFYSSLSWWSQRGGGRSQSRNFRKEWLGWREGCRLRQNRVQREEHMGIWGWSWMSAEVWTSGGDGNKQGIGHERIWGRWTLGPSIALQPLNISTVYIAIGHLSYKPLFKQAAEQSQSCRLQSAVQLQMRGRLAGKSHKAFSRGRRLGCI